MGAFQSGQGVSLSNWRNNWASILSNTRVVFDEADEATLLDDILLADGPRVLAFVNAHAMNLLAERDDLLQPLLDANYLLRDGSGMRILYGLMGLGAGINMNGTDFIPKVLEKYKGKRIAIWGTQEPYLSEAATNINRRFNLEVVSIQHGFESIEYYTGLSKKIQVDLILLGMGMPKQEQLAHQLRKKNESTLIICGGAIIDFLGNKVSRAPNWIRQLGLEWLYRLLCEPRRLFKRYVIGNPLFIYRALLLRLWSCR